MHHIIEIIKESAYITMFVIVMMLLIEYINVVSRGKITNLKATKLKQYSIAVLLGIIPGCLGGFAAAAMYAHGAVSIGAIAAAMIATTGDDAFVMFSLFPLVAIGLHAGLAVIGIAAGYAADALLKNRFVSQSCCDGIAHKDIIPYSSYSLSTIFALWKNISFARALLSTLLFAGMIMVVTGQFHQEEGFIQIALPIIIAIAIVIVAIVPEHFLQEHLWEHVVKKHLLKIFIWTTGVLIAIHVIVDILQLENYIHNIQWLVLIAAVLVGIIPISGPHLIFIVMFAKGMVPLSVLVANSIVQDGHAMLPILAHSRRDFFVIKLINVIVGITVGGIIMALGY